MSFVGFTTAASSASTSMPITVSGSAIAGDWLCFLVTCSNSTAPVFPGTITTLASGLASPGTSRSYAIGVRFMQAGDTSFTITLATTATVASAICYVQRGGSSATPVLFSAVEGASTFNTSIPSASGALGSSSDLAVYGYSGFTSAGSGSRTFTPPAGLLDVHQASNASLGDLTAFGWGTGLTGLGNGTVDTGIIYADFLIDIAPLGAPSASVAPAQPGPAWRNRFQHKRKRPVPQIPPAGIPAPPLPHDTPVQTPTTLDMSPLAQANPLMEFTPWPPGEPLTIPIQPYLIASSGQASGSVSYTIPITAASNAGDGIVVLVSAGGAAPPAVSSVADSKNKYIIRESFTSSSPIMAVATTQGDVALATSDTLTVTFASAATGGISVVAAATPGMRTLDVNTAPVNGSSVSPAITGTPSQGAEMALACFVWANAAGAGTISPPFSQLGQAHPTGGSYATLAFDYSPPAGTGLTASAAITTAAWRAVMLTLVPVAPWFMSNSTFVHQMYQNDPPITARYFNTPAAYAISTVATSTGIQDGFLITPILKYTSYAQLQSDISGGVINAAFTWLMYDNEYEDDGAGGNVWPTPMNEANDPWTFMASFTTLGHANSYKVLLAPGRDLGNDATSVNPKTGGETLDAWYIRTNIAGSAATSGADVVHIQAQADQTPLASFTSFWNSTLAQVAAGSGSAQTSVGISTSRGTANDMLAAAQAVTATTWGFWLNSTTPEIPEATQFLELYAAGSPAPAAGSTVYSQALSALVNLTGTITRQAGKVLTGTANVTGSLKRQAGKIMSGTVNVPAALARQVSKIVLALVNVAGTLTRSAGKLLAAVVNASATLVRQPGKSLKAAVNITGSLVRSAGKIIPATVNVTGSLARQISKITLALVNVTGTLAAARGKFLAAAVNVSGSLTRQSGKLLVSAVNATGSLVRSVGKTASATVNVTAVLARRIGKIAAAVVNVSGAVLRAAPLALSAAVNASASLIRSAGKQLAGTVNVTGALSRSAGKILAGTVNVSAALARQIGKITAAAVSLNAAMTLQKVRVLLLAAAVNANAAVTRRISAAFAASANINAAVVRTIGKALTGTANITGSLARSIGKLAAAVVNLTGTLSQIKVKVLALAASVNAAATLRNQVGKPLAVSVNAAASLRVQAGKLLTATANVTGSLVRQIGKLLTGTVNLSTVLTQIKTRLVTLAAQVNVPASLARQVGRPLAATVNVTASLVNRISKLIKATVNAAASVTVQIGKLLSSHVNVAATASVIRAQLVTLTATVNATGRLARNVGKTVAGTVSATAAAAIRIGKTIAGAVNAAGSAVKTASKTLSGSVNAPSTLAALRVRLVALAASVNVTGTLKQSVGKTLSAAVNITASTVRQIARKLAVTVQVTATSIRARLVVLSASVKTAGSVIAQIFRPVGNVVFKLGVPATRWITGTAKKIWRIP